MEAVEAVVEWTGPKGKWGSPELEDVKEISAEVNGGHDGEEK